MERGFLGRGFFKDFWTSLTMVLIWKGVNVLAWVHTAWIILHHELFRCWTWTSCIIVCVLIEKCTFSPISSLFSFFFIWIKRKNWISWLNVLIEWHLCPKFEKKSSFRIIIEHNDNVRRQCTFSVVIRGTTVSIVKDVIMQTLLEMWHFQLVWMICVLISVLLCVWWSTKKSLGRKN